MNDITRPAAFEVRELSEQEYSKMMEEQTLTDHVSVPEWLVGLLGIEKGKLWSDHDKQMLQGYGETRSTREILEEVALKAFESTSLKFHTSNNRKFITPASELTYKVASDIKKGLEKELFTIVMAKDPNIKRLLP